MRRAGLAASAATLVLLAAPLPAAALDLGTTGAPFTVSADPAAPAPYGQVTLTPAPGDIDIAGTAMTVSINGAQVYSGNTQPVAIRMGAAGKTETVTVSIKAGGGTYKQVLTLTPQGVALVAEPLSSAPPLYPGKPLPPLGGSVRVVAVADLRTAGGAQLDPATLSYDWTVDGTEDIAGSGVGKRAVIVGSPLEYRTRTVSVTVTSPSGAQVASGSLTIAPAEPTMRIYERDPLLGIRFERALGGTFALAGSEASLYAAPYSFPTALGAPALTWYVGGNPAQAGNLVTLRPTGSGSGTASVSVTGASSGSIEAPAASAQLTVSFGAAASGILGL